MKSLCALVGSPLGGIDHSLDMMSCGLIRIIPTCPQSADNLIIRYNALASALAAQKRCEYRKETEIEANLDTARHDAAQSPIDSGCCPGVIQGVVGVKI